MRRILFASGLLLGPVFAVLPITASAADLSLLGGIQFNTDFVVTDYVATDPPPQEPGQPGESIGLDNGALLGLALDFKLSQDPTGRFGVHASTHQTDIGSRAGLNQSGLEISHLHLVGTRLYPRDRWESFVLAGVGVTRFVPDDASLQSSTDFSLQIGAGTYFNITDTISLRLDARWIPIFTGGDVAAICSGGCVIGIDSDLYSPFQVNAGLAFRF